jgi:multisubunit Na+/H+ antiporter MnhB subunit
MKWHVSESGAVFTATDTQIAQMLRGGGVSAGALVWRPGLATWQPVAIHFPGPDHSPRRIPLASLVIVVLLLAGLVLAALIAFRPDVVPYAIWRFVPWLIQGGAITAAMFQGAMLVVVAFLLYRLCLRYRRSGRRPYAGSAVAIGTLVLTFSAIATSSLLYHLPDLVGAEEASKDLEDYFLAVNDAAHSVYLFGPIGPGLLTSLLAAEQKSGPIARFEIDSEGGLVSEAMDVADYLAKNNVEVVAHNICDSACIVIALASPRSFADRDMSFGFHRVYAPVESAYLDYWADVSWQGTQAYLREHKVPDDIVEHAADYGPDRVLEVPAETLVRSGALKGLVDPPVYDDEEDDDEDAGPDEKL